MKMKSDKSTRDTCPNGMYEHVAIPIAPGMLYNACLPTCVFIFGAARAIVRQLYQNFKIGNETFTRENHIRIAAAKHIAATKRIDDHIENCRFHFLAETAAKHHTQHTRTHQHCHG